MKLYYPDYYDQSMEESDAGLYYLASEVDARIAELEKALHEIAQGVGHDGAIAIARKALGL